MQQQIIFETKQTDRQYEHLSCHRRKNVFFTIFWHFKKKSRCVLADVEQNKKLATQQSHHIIFEFLSIKVSQDKKQIPLSPSVGLKPIIPNYRSEVAWFCFHYTV